MPSLEEPLGKVQSLPQPPPLGFPVPPYRHAVSVQLPTWQDMKGMVAQEPRVLQVQQIGYPRSFLNQDVKKVSHDPIWRLTRLTVHDSRRSTLLVLLCLVEKGRIV
jgi:hypothetical protein